MFKKKFSIILSLVILLVLLGFLAQKVYIDLIKSSTLESIKTADLMDEKVNSLFLKMANFPGNPVADLMFLSDISSLKKLVNTPEDEVSGKILGDVEKDFLDFLKNETVYYQLRYISRTGEEIIRVEFDGQEYVLAEKSSLQDKFSRDYLYNTVRLNKGEVYISPMELNVENKEIENRGTEEDPDYVPVVRYSTPMINDEGENNGTLIFNVFASYFLDDIKEYQSEDDKIFLVNREGGYFSHPDKGKEFSFVFNSSDNFYNDYPEVPKGILANTSKRRFETDDFSFSFRRIHLGMKSLRDHHPKDGDNFWVLVDVFEKGEIERVHEDLKDNYRYFLVVLIISIIFFAFVLLKRCRKV